MDPGEAAKSPDEATHQSLISKRTRSVYCIRAATRKPLILRGESLWPS